MIPEHHDAFDVPDVVDPASAASLPPLPVPREPSPTRRDVRTHGAVAAAVVLVFEAALVARHGVRSQLNASMVVFGVLVPLAFFGATLTSAVSTRASVQRVVRGVALSFAMLMVGAVLSSGSGDRTFHAALACIGLSSAMAIVPLVCALWILRHAFAWAVGVRATSLGIAAGLLGAGAIRIVCPNDALEHLFLGHIAPVVGITWIGFTIGRRICRA